MIVTIIKSDLLELDEVEVQSSGLSGDPDGDYHYIQANDYVCDHILVSYVDRDDAGVEETFKLAIPLDEFPPTGITKILAVYKDKKTDSAGWESMVRGALDEALEKGFGIEYLNEDDLINDLNEKAVERSESEYANNETAYAEARAEDYYDRD